MRISIIGLGLIGGSIGLALKQRGIKDIEIIGHTRSSTTSERALARGAVDRVCWNVNDAIEKADLVLVATPVLTVKDVFQTIAAGLPQGCVVTDVCSTKSQVMSWAKAYLPDHVSFVGGHPMAGKEKAGIDEADGKLFEGCRYCVIPSETASDSAVEAVTKLAEHIGANPLFIEAEEHDGLVAGISHLPMLLATALIDCTVNSSSWQDLARLASSGFRDTSRLASGDPDMHYSIFRTNSKAVSRWIDAVVAQLQEYRQRIEDGDESFLEHLENVKKARDQWLETKTSGITKTPAVELQTPQDEMRQFLGGNLLFKRPKRPDK